MWMCESFRMVSAARTSTDRRGSVQLRIRENAEARDRVLDLDETRFHWPSRIDSEGFVTNECGRTPVPYLSVVSTNTIMNAKNLFLALSVIVGASASAATQQAVRWTRLANLNTPHQYHACVAVDGKIYTVGGNEK